MNTYDRAINELRRPLQTLAYDDFAALQAQAFEGFVPNWNNLPTPEQILSEMPPDVGDDVSPFVLGSYRPMNSPGLITLNVVNLQQFYWSVVREIARRLPGFPFFKQDLEFLATFIVEKTWHHELFHHSMEVLRHLVNGAPYDLEEEALAVAHARRCLRESKWNSQIGRMGKIMYNLAMDIAFVGYAPPYSGWMNYDSPERLQAGIVDLLQPPQRIFLESSNVPVANILAGLIPVQYGYVDQIINPYPSLTRSLMWANG